MVPVRGGGRGKEEEWAGLEAGCTSSTWHWGMWTHVWGTAFQPSALHLKCGIPRRPGSTLGICRCPQTPGRKCAGTVGTRLLKFRKEGMLGVVGI